MPSSHEITITAALDDDPKLPCWPAALNQACMNVMVNACQAIRTRH